MDSARLPIKKSLARREAPPDLFDGPGGVFGNEGLRVGGRQFQFP